MNVERVIFVPFYFLLALVVVSLLVGVVTGVAIIKSFALTLFAVTAVMFVFFLFVVAAGCIWHDMAKMWSDN